MTIKQTRENEKLILELDGRLDAAASPGFQEALLPAFEEYKNVELDFTKLAYVSSAGLRILLIARKTATAKNATLVITGVSEDVMEVLDMTGFSDILTII